MRQTGVEKKTREKLLTEIERLRQQVMHKLNIHSITELTKYAIREGLTTLEK